MNRKSMVIFFPIVFSVYFLVNIYLFIKGFRAIPKTGYGKIIYTIIFILFALSFLAGKIAERNHSSPLTDFLSFAGSFWLAFMLYAFLFLLVTDILSPFLKLTGLINSGNIQSFRKWLFIFAVALSSLLILAGYLNTLTPVVRHYNISINKKAGDYKTYKIAAVSDIHLGSNTNIRFIKKLSDILTRVKPDAVFLLGDIVDGEIVPVIRKDLLKHFTCPRCNDGLLAITGNHEFIGGASITIPYIESKGIKILKDEVAVIDGGIQVIGRIDRDGFRYNSYRRAPLAELIEKTDTSKPLIVLDHQPVNLDEAANAGIDLQLSGHTHRGQMWPLNYITEKVYENSYGIMKKGKTYFIVSSGYGLWGPRVRLGSKPEIVVVDIVFEN